MAGFIFSYFVWYLKQFVSFQGKAPADNSSVLLQGKMKSIYDYSGMKAVESAVKNMLDPTPNHECHISKNAAKVTSLLAYRAYELTQVQLSLVSFLQKTFRKRTSELGRENPWG